MMLARDTDIDMNWRGVNTLKVNRHQLSNALGFGSRLYHHALYTKRSLCGVESDINCQIEKKQTIPGLTLID